MAPVFMAMVTRSTAAGAIGVQQYVHRVRKEKNRSMPSEDVCRTMSELMDKASFRAYHSLQRQLERSIEFQRAVEVIRKAPVCCGGFTKRRALLKAILRGLTPFEQTAALCSWVKGPGKNIKKDHSFALASEEDRIVPIWVKRPKQRYKPSPMTVIVGHSAGKVGVRSPSYTKKNEKDFPGWDERDPKGNPDGIFIEPINGLEMHRQPDYIGALLLKSNLYDRDSITNEWRYKVYQRKPEEFAREASVEIPQQQTKKAREVKKSSAGYNLAKMIEMKHLRRKNLMPELHCEDYRDWYNDNAEPFVSPYSIVKTFPAALKGNTDSLDEEMAKLFAQKLGISTIPVVEIFAADTLFPE